MIVSCPLTTLPHSSHICKSEKLPNTDQQSPTGLSRPVFRTDAEVTKAAGIGIHDRLEIRLSDASACEKATTKERGYPFCRTTGLRLRAGAFSWGRHV